MNFTNFLLHCKGPIFTSRFSAAHTVDLKSSAPGCLLEVLVIFVEFTEFHNDFETGGNSQYFLTLVPSLINQARYYSAINTFPAM